MIKPDIYKDEDRRLEELESFHIMDSIAEIEYDNITKIAAQICGTNISLVSLVDDKRQWFKSRYNLNAPETPKEIAFCAHAINKPDEIMIVPDSREDERFHDNPLATGYPHVIFYAGVPLVTDNGLPLGTLCVIDENPHELDDSQKDALRALGNQVMQLLKLRKTNYELVQNNRDLENRNLQLDKFAAEAAHDLKSPLTTIEGSINFLLNDSGKNYDEVTREMMEVIYNSSHSLRKLVDDLLSFSRSDKVMDEKTSSINVMAFFKELQNLYSYEKNLDFNYICPLPVLQLNETALKQILMNLMSNAIKYNDKDIVKIRTTITETSTHYKFIFEDNGRGIAKEDIFTAFEINTVGEKDKYGKQGHGIGLATVKKIIQLYDGKISLESELGKGCKFTFTMKRG